jgi:S-adenosylmethionine-dependent methyltransferase
MAKRPPSAAFDSVAAAFADYGTTVRGYVRYHLTQRNLEPYLPPKGAAVLDVGGGSGGDTAWLVGKGCKVTFIEPSGEQCGFAERRFNFFLDDEERKRITMAGESLNDLPSNAQFALVLVHAVAQYQDNPAALLKQAMQYVQPGGLISIIEKGYYGAELRNIRDRNFADLARLQNTQRSINNLRQNVYASKPEELEKLLTDTGFTVVDWSGIRLITDDFDMSVDRVPANQLKLILQAEYEHGHHPAIRGQGQLLHFIARKNG